MFQKGPFFNKNNNIETQCKSNLPIVYTSINGEQISSLTILCQREPNHLESQHLCSHQLTALYFSLLGENYPGIENWCLQVKQSDLKE